jgi:hypothetical protein
MAQRPDDPWRLEIFWYEQATDGHERLLSYCGEMLGFLHKLSFVRHGFGEALGLDDVEAAYEHAEYHLENYLYQVYALRDRALNALSLRTAKSTKSLKAPGKREQKAAELRVIAPEETELLVELLALIDDEIELRNRLTHSHFFHIWLFDGTEVFEPDSVLLQAGDAVKPRMRELLDRFLQPYCDKIGRVIEATERYVHKLMGIQSAPALAPNEAR